MSCQGIEADRNVSVCWFGAAARGASYYTSYAVIRVLVFFSSAPASYCHSGYSRLHGLQSSNRYRSIRSSMTHHTWCWFLTCRVTSYKHHAEIQKFEPTSESLPLALVETQVDQYQYIMVKKRGLRGIIDWKDKNYHILGLPILDTICLFSRERIKGLRISICASESTLLAGFWN